MARYGYIKQFILILFVIPPLLFSSLDAGLTQENSRSGRPIRHTPFDKKIALSGVFTSPFQSAILSQSHSRVEDIFAVARRFRYRKDVGGDYWQTAQETERKLAGDCEDKAVWLYQMLQANGYESIRLVIGKYRPVERILHVWIEHFSQGETYILDPANQSRVWSKSKMQRGFYKPYYSYNKNEKMRYPRSKRI